MPMQRTFDECSTSRWWTWTKGLRGKPGLVNRMKILYEDSLYVCISRRLQQSIIQTFIFCAYTLIFQIFVFLISMNHTYIHKSLSNSHVIENSSLKKDSFSPFFTSLIIEFGAYLYHSLYTTVFCSRFSRQNSRERRQMGIN